MSNYYNAAETAAMLTGAIEGQITQCIHKGDYFQAKKLNDLLINAYTNGGWSEVCDRWLTNFKEQRDKINSLIHESTSTKRDSGLTEVW